MVEKPSTCSESYDQLTSKHYSVNDNTNDYPLSLAATSSHSNTYRLCSGESAADSSGIVPRKLNTFPQWENLYPINLIRNNRSYARYLIRARPLNSIIHNHQCRCLNLLLRSTGTGSSRNSYFISTSSSSIYQAH